jgi:hypothetical protein
MDVNEFITVLPKTHKTQKVVKYFCTLCKCMVGDVEEHQDGEKHAQLADIMDILPMLQQCGIGMYFAPSPLLLLLSLVASSPCLLLLPPTCCFYSLLVAKSMNWLCRLDG